MFPFSLFRKSVDLQGVASVVAALLAAGTLAAWDSAAAASQPRTLHRDFVSAAPGQYASCPSPGTAQHTLRRHVSAIMEHGKEPVRFAVAALRTADLLVFDDGLHTAKEPFDFYARLIADPDFQAVAPTVFFEMLPANRQAAIDAYLSTEPESQELLYPAFQDEFGWPYQTYFDLMHAIYQANRKLPKDRQIKVRAVSTPSVWQEIHSQADWESNASNVELSRDFFMYALINEGLGGFRSSRKGIFLTNTRHAYTALRQKDGSRFRTTASLIKMWHPGKSVSIRINAPVLNVAGKRSDPNQPRSQSGEEQFEIAWTRVADGLWDEAFAAAGGALRVVPLANTPFGEAGYRGNLMLAAAPGQTMSGAYDAVMYLGDAGFCPRACWPLIPIDGPAGFDRSAW